jgi:hypothetical protein
MTRYEERLRALNLGLDQLAAMIEAETDDLRRCGRDTAKDHSIKLVILRKLRDELTTPELALV